MTLKIVLLVWISIPLNVLLNNWWFHALTIFSLSFLLLLLEFRHRSNLTKCAPEKMVAGTVDETGESATTHQLLEQQTEIFKEEIAALKQLEQSNLILGDSYRLFLQFVLEHSQELAKNEESSAISLDVQFVKELLGHMEENLSNPLFSVNNLCRKLSLSQPSLYRKVRHLTGHSPQLFIRSYRLERSVQLLKNNYGNVTQVCFDVGFTSTAYFTKCFKEKFNQLPSAVGH